MMIWRSADSLGPPGVADKMRRVDPQHAIGVFPDVVRAITKHQIAVAGIDSHTFAANSLSTAACQPAHPSDTIEWAGPMPLVMSAKSQCSMSARYHALLTGFPAAYDPVYAEQNRGCFLPARRYEPVGPRKSAGRQYQAFHIDCQDSCGRHGG